MNTSSIELKKRIKQAYELAEECRLCPRKCGIDRTKGEKGFCRADFPSKIYSYRKYLGEEPPISGTKGSGVIFFSHCTMRCIYCQNSRFSQLGEGYRADKQILYRIMKYLKDNECHNINLVTPSHYLPVVLEALLLAKDKISTIPIVYNTSGYECQDTLDLLDGIVDIYLVDMRYGDDSLAKKFSATDNYVDINRQAVSIMYRQVGNLILDSNNIAKRGIIIRHLILPNLLSNTETVIRYIADNISKEIYISLMSQYIPLYKAKESPCINRSITQKEYNEACKLLERYGFHNGWIQEI